MAEYLVVKDEIPKRIFQNTGHNQLKQEEIYMFKWMMFKTPWSRVAVVCLSLKIACYHTEYIGLPTEFHFAVFVLFINKTCQI